MPIHPTAIIGSGARLGANVEIGAYAVVEDQVVIGDDCVIQAHAILTNNVTLGRRNLIGYGAVIGSAPQDHAHQKSVQSSVVIGDDNVLREYVTIHRGSTEGTTTSVGNGNMLMTGSHLGHNVKLGDRNIVANNCLFAGYVDVADDIVFGGGAVFHQFIRVGRMAMIRGGTAWSKDVPPFTIGRKINTLSGLNSVGMRRKGVSTAARKEVKDIFNLIFRSGRNITQAIDDEGAIAHTAEGAELVDFVRLRSKRGLSRAQGIRRGPDSEPDLD